MNMNKTEKLLAARKRLKEFQKNKNHTQESVPASRKDQQTFSPAQEPTRTIEIPPNIDSNFLQNAGQKIPEICETSNDSTASIIADFSKTANFTIDSQIADSNPAEKSTEAINYFTNSPELKVDEKPSVIEERPSHDFQNHRTEDGSISGSASPSPLINFSENETENSPSSQKDNLLKMASEVANAMTENSDSLETIPRDATDEYRNEFLSSSLEEQKQLVNQLRVQVSRYGSRISELEAILATRECEFEAKLMREVNPLKEQLLVHAQTTGILVAEKAELSSAIEECRGIVQRKSEEAEELNGRLKSFQIRVNEAEKESSHLRNIVDDTRKLYQQLHLDYAELEKRYNELSKLKEDDELESSELRQELSLKNSENLSLQRELEEKNTLLSLSELKIQQLSNTPQEVEGLEGHHQALVILEQQLLQTRETLNTVSKEKDEAAKQYENYVRQLDSRYESVVKELEESRLKTQAMEDREKSYIERLSELEKNLQREKEKVEKLLPMESNEERIEHLTKALEALSLEHANLQSTMNDRENEIEVLRRDLEESRERNEDSVEKSKLVTALESEQLGASRAVLQNQQLKVQLNEMHDAFVTLSNSKLDLTEQLQAERNIGKKLNARLNNVEEEMDKLKEELKRKEITIDDMEREKLQTAQIADQMHHYQAQSNHARTLQQELQNSLGCIEILRRENEELTMKLNAMRENDPEAGNLYNGDDRTKMENNNGEGSRKNSSHLSFKTFGDGNSMISDPLKKLEIRFKETMERVAELTDEKQRLEHLVLQLQGETETIGEYITLYQKQRGILQKKATEREEMFRQLVEQRNHQQEQLHQLKVLVADLIKKKSSNSLEAQNKSNPSIIEFENEKQESQEPEIDKKEIKDAESVVDVKDTTTSKILDLLTEIKDCKDTCILEPNFHPCPWCSGKLITI